MRHKRHEVGLSDAGRADATAFPGGIEALSRLVYNAPRTLSHKLAGVNGAELGIEAATVMQQLTGTRHIVSAMAAELGGVFVQLPDVPALEDNEDLMISFMKASQRLGDLARKVSESLADDGVVDVHERAKLLRSAHELQTDVLHYLTQLDRVYGDAEVQALLRTESEEGVRHV